MEKERLQLRQHLETLQNELAELRQRMAQLETKPEQQPSAAGPAAE